MSTIVIVAGVAANLHAGNLAFSLGAVHLALSDVDAEVAVARILRAHESGAARTIVIAAMNHSCRSREPVWIF